MGKMTLRESLSAENKGANPLFVGLVADALETYLEAQKNITERGSVCAHPRTGAPIENPYIKVRASQVAVLAKFRQIRTEATLRAFALS
jgi:hypothetical protein